MAATSISRALTVILPKKRVNEKGTSFTSTFQPTQTNQVLSVPGYREHLIDLFNSRGSDDSRTLLQNLFIHDPDVSAAVNVYLTVANTEPYFYVRDMEGVIDRDGYQLLREIITGLVSRFDYSDGFRLQPTLRGITESMRYMLLLRGGIAAEAVFDKTLLLREIRHVDLSTIRWFEKAPGVYKPVQQPPGSNVDINLDIPTFFVNFYRRDPTKIYTYSPFVSSINTISARQLVINDLYRIMNYVGFPRIDVKVVEEILRKNAPANVLINEQEMRTWLQARMTEIANAIANIRPDQPFVHSDAVEPTILNSGGPQKALDVSSVVDVLNAQNQASLKAMSTMLGRGDSGVNTASVEASIFSQNAEEINDPVSAMMSGILTLAMRLSGFEGTVEVGFEKVDLRPDLELEPHRVMRQSRLNELLSYGLISDDDWHFEMFGRPRPDDIEEKSGTMFFGAKQALGEDAPSPNSDPMGRAIAPPGGKSAKSKTVQK